MDEGVRSRDGGAYETWDPTQGAFSISGVGAAGFGAPEPGSIALLGFGGFAPTVIGVVKYRRRHGKKA